MSITATCPSSASWLRSVTIRPPESPSPGADPGPAESLAPYAGRWVAVFGGQVIGQGGTPEQARLAARQARFKEVPQVSYVPTSQPLTFGPLLERVVAALPPDLPVYLVGGAVRDALRGQQARDLDFILSGDVLALARRLGDRLGAAFYPLDAPRRYARLVLQDPQQGRLMLDFAPIAGDSLETDLESRDFTINAMAVEVRHPFELLDPLGGAADLLAKRLRACSPQAFRADPLRILRAVRQAAAFGLKIMPETRKQMRQAVDLLGTVSPERMRDELFRILEGPQPAVVLRALEMLGVLPHLLPELTPLKGLSQSPPHIYDVWEHTLEVLNRLEALLEALRPDYDPERAANLFLGLAVLRLGRYRRQIQTHLEASLTIDRSPRALLFLAALYHDVGKAGTRQVEADGRIRFFHHDQLGEQLTTERAQALRLSKAEIERLRIVVRHHLRPLLLAQSDDLPSRRAVYRFFRQTGPAGVEVCLLSLADLLAAYGVTLPQATWARHLEVVQLLLDAWWEKPDESVSPLPLITGHDLIRQFNLQPGPQIGRLLEAIREAQAAGQVQTRQQALALAQDLLETQAE